LSLLASKSARITNANLRRRFLTLYFDAGYFIVARVRCPLPGVSFASVLKGGRAESMTCLFIEQFNPFLI